MAAAADGDDDDDDVSDAVAENSFRFAQFFDSDNANERVTKHTQAVALATRVGVKNIRPLFGGDEDSAWSRFMANPSYAPRESQHRQQTCSADVLKCMLGAGMRGRLNESCDGTGQYPLHRAVRTRHWILAHALLDLHATEGLDPNADDGLSEGGGPLWRECWVAHNDVSPPVSAHAAGEVFARLVTRQHDLNARVPMSVRGSTKTKHAVVVAVAAQAVVGAAVPAAAAAAAADVKTVPAAAAAADVKAAWVAPAAEVSVTAATAVPVPTLPVVVQERAALARRVAERTGATPDVVLAIERRTVQETLLTMLQTPAKMGLSQAAARAQLSVAALSYAGIAAPPDMLGAHVDSVVSKISAQLKPGATDAERQQAIRRVVNDNAAVIQANEQAALRAMPSVRSEMARCRQAGVHDAGATSLMLALSHPDRLDTVKYVLNASTSGSSGAGAGAYDVWAIDAHGFSARDWLCGHVLRRADVRVREHKSFLVMAELLDDAALRYDAYGHDVRALLSTGTCGSFSAAALKASSRQLQPPPTDERDLDEAEAEAARVASAAMAAAAAGINVAAEELNTLSFPCACFSDAFPLQSSLSALVWSYMSSIPPRGALQVLTRDMVDAAMPQSKVLGY